MSVQVLNRTEFQEWMASRAKLGYSFTSIKAHVPGATYSDGQPCLKRNVAWICTQTNERFDFIFSNATP